MRAWSMGVLAGLVAMFGIAAGGHANATIGLARADGGSTNQTLAACNAIELNVVSSTGLRLEREASISPDGDAQPVLAIAGITNESHLRSRRAKWVPAVGHPIEPSSAPSAPNVATEPLVGALERRLGTVSPEIVATGEGQVGPLSAVGRIDGLRTHADTRSSGSPVLQSAIVNRVPEPGTVTLVSLGLLGIAIVGRPRS
jgi:hypothetical protein